MERYLKIISQTVLITTLVIIVIIIASLIIWKNNQPSKPILVEPISILPITPITESILANNSPIVGSIDQIKNDTIWVSRWGNTYEIKIDPTAQIIKMKKPIPIAPGSQAKIIPPIKTSVTASYLKLGQQVKINSQIISSSPIFLATSLEIWE